MMNKHLLVKELREARLKFIIGLVYFLVLGVIVAVSYEFLKQLGIEDLLPGAGRTSGFLGNLMKQLEFLLKDFDVYLWSQWHAKNVIQSGTIFSIILGMNLISGEISNKTMGFLLSKPISKDEIYATKAVSGLIILYSVIIISTAAVAGITWFRGYRPDVSKLLLGLVPPLVGFTAVFFTALLFSGIYEDSVKAGLITGLIWGALSLFSFSRYTYKLSPFFHMRAPQYIFEGEFPVLETVVLGGIALLIYFIGLKTFKGKEF
jgi:ABC-type transport system involved in multi-copper enzyme maturation permease subunit